MDLFLASLETENWFIVKFLIALSGLLLLFNLKIENK
jgi:hypothetical protein